MPESSGIESATLNLHVTGISGNGSSLCHLGKTATPAIGDASQCLVGDQLVFDLSPAAVGDPGWLSIDVTSQIQNDLDAGHAFAAFSLPYKSYSWLEFSSAESGAGAYLSVMAVPEPSGIVILALPLTGLLRRRRHSTSAARQG